MPKKKSKPAKKALKKKKIVKPKKHKNKKPGKTAAAKKNKKKSGDKKGAHVAYLGLGGNVGDREEYIEQAVFLLNKTAGISVTKRSTNYETEAEGQKNQAPFINAAIEVKTKLSPQKLLESVQEIETTLGREREVEWGPRTIDIDILLYDDEILSEDELQIPHPLLHERYFVLLPLREIAGDKIHPVLEKSIADIYEEKKEEMATKYDDDLPGFKDVKEGSSDNFERW